MSFATATGARISTCGSGPGPWAPCSCAAPCCRSGWTSCPRSPRCRQPRRSPASPLRSTPLEVARTPEGPPPPPAVQRLRVHYAKRGRLRFSSHRDFQRAFERALRRADVPMAFSAGFSPHPKVSYAGAAPTGVASEAEYLEISVTQRCDPERVRAALDEALPPGLDILEVVEVPLH